MALLGVFVAIFAIAIRLSGVLNTAPESCRHGSVTPEKAVANPNSGLQPDLEATLRDEP